MAANRPSRRARILQIYLRRPLSLRSDSLPLIISMMNRLRNETSPKMSARAEGESAGRNRPRTRSCAGTSRRGAQGALICINAGLPILAFFE
uniref:Uncharacterized protein n=1 Tax=Trichuris muris TaxID=70415 RepID=A0A5S6QHV0_TRIMR